MTVVAKDVPPFAIIEGNPGAIIGMRFDLEVASKIRKAAWWKYTFWELSNLPINDVSAFVKHIECLSKLNPYEPELFSLRKLASFTERT